MRPTISDCSCDTRFLTALPPGWDDEAHLLSVLEDDVTAFRGYPLSHLDCFQKIESSTRTSPSMLGLPFDLSAQAAYQNNPPAVQMVARMEADIRGTSGQDMKSTTIKSVEAALNSAGVEDGEVDSKGAGKGRGSMTLAACLVDLLAIQTELAAALQRDSDEVRVGIQAIERIVNDKPKIDDSAEHICFRLKRQAGARAHLWFELIVASLLSTRQKQDLLALNPFISEEMYKSINAAVIGLLLRFVRSRQIISCLVKLQSLIALVESYQNRLADSPADSPADSSSSFFESHRFSSLIEGSESHSDGCDNEVRAIRHKSAELAAELTQRRHFVATAASQALSSSEGCEGFEFDPRYLIFEYITGFLLRGRQVELVTQFMGSYKAGESSVHQMIMGE